MEINRKLKALYFLWQEDSADPRWNWNTTFEAYLEFTYYNFDKNWLLRVLKEFGIESEDSFKVQLILIEESHSIYRRQQVKKYERRQQKKWNRLIERSAKDGVLFF